MRSLSSRNINAWYNTSNIEILLTNAQVETLDKVRYVSPLEGPDDKHLQKLVAFHLLHSDELNIGCSSYEYEFRY